MNNMIDYQTKDILTQQKCVIYKEIDEELSLLSQAIKTNNVYRQKEIKNHLSALVEQLHKFDVI